MGDAEPTACLRVRVAAFNLLFPLQMALEGQAVDVGCGT